MKQVYEAPQLEEMGSFEGLTQGGVDGNFTDFLFPANTPKGDLTFS